MRLAFLLVASCATLIAIPVSASPPGTHVVISEVRSRGVNGAGDEFVELLNPTCDMIDISGWTLLFRSSVASVFSLRATVPANSRLNPGNHYLISGTSYPGFPPGDTFLTSGITDAGLLRLLTSTGDPVDAVGFAFDATSHAAVSAFNPEGVPASNLPHDNSNSSTSNSDVSLTRKASGVQDTDNNADDFEGDIVSSPENLTSVPLPIDCTTGVGGNQLPAALSFSIAGNNPFHESTLLACALPNSSRVRIDVFSVDGRRISTLVDRELEAGRHLVPLHLRGPAGVYLVRLTAGSEQRRLRIVALH